MRQFLLPFLLVAIGGADIERAILSYLGSHYPILDTEYVCELSGVMVQAPEADSVAVDGFGMDNPRGHTTARLSFYMQGNRVQSLTINVKIDVLKPVLIAATTIQPGTRAKKAEAAGGLEAGPLDFTSIGQFSSAASQGIETNSIFEFRRHSIGMATRSILYQ